MALFEWRPEESSPEEKPGPIREFLGAIGSIIFLGLWVGAVSVGVHWIFAKPVKYDPKLDDPKHWEEWERKIDARIDELVRDSGLPDGPATEEDYQTDPPEPPETYGYGPMAR